MIEISGIKKQLKASACKKDAEVISWYSPGAKNIMGVRVPVMRKLNKKIIKYCKSDPKKGKDLLLKMWATGIFELMWMAEDGVRGLDTKKALEFTDKIKGGINNWIHSDTLLCAMRKHGKANPAIMMKISEKYSKSPKPWVRRLGIIFPIIVIGYHLQYLDRTLKILSRNMKDDHDYVVKGVSWTCACCYYYVNKTKTKKWLDKYKNRKSSLKATKACLSRIKAYQKRRNQFL